MRATCWKTWEGGGSECQLQMVDNPVHGGIIRDEGDDLHYPAALAAEHLIDVKNLFEVSSGPHSEESSFRRPTPSSPSG